MELSATAVTVFVGPNYSGKSLAVSEIAARLQSGDNPDARLVLDSIEISPLTEPEAETAISGMALKPKRHETIQPGAELFGFDQYRYQVPRHLLRDTLLNPGGRPQYFAQWYAQHKTLILDGANRINLVQEQDLGDLQEPPHSSFQKLFRNDDLRDRLRNIVHKAFGLFLVVDPTKVGKVRLRLSFSPPASAEVERGLTEESVKFHGNAVLMNETSDGARAFVGIMSEIVAGDPSVLLIDEPEAFLHPSLAFQLGKEISGELTRSNKQMFVSTHSAHFIMGCLQSGADVNIVRLTYRDGVATARLMPSADLRSLMRNPLLRSANVVSALFHESVVVTESDADRAFYQEINERMLRENSNRGIPNATFLNAQNKQTIPTIIKPLRQLGIPSAAVYDIDIFKDSGSVAKNFLLAAGIPELAENSLNTLRANVMLALKNTGKDFKREGGIGVLNAGEREAAQNFIDQLEAYGAFIIPGGELESWLKRYEIAGHGPGWLVPMFERLGEDPAAADYVHAGEGDVWAFLDRIQAWLHDPSRKGIPN